MFVCVSKGKRSAWQGHCGVHLPGSKKAGIRVGAVELCAGILPTYSCQYLALDIYQAYWHAAQRIKIFHQRLDRWGIDDVAQVQVANVPFASQNAFVIQ